MGGNNEYFENVERNKYLKKIPSMPRVKGAEKGFIGLRRGRSKAITVYLTSLSR